MPFFTASEKHIGLAARAPERAVMFHSVSLYAGYLLIGFHSLVDQRLRLGLQEKHLHIVLPFPDQDIVPFSDGVVITETLAVFAVKLFYLHTLLLLGAGKFLQCPGGTVNLKPGLDHPGTAGTFYLHKFTGLLRRFLLRVGVFVPRYDKTGHDKRQAQCKRCHKRGGCRIRYAEGHREPCIGRGQKILGFPYCDKLESGVLVERVEHLL